MKKFDWCDFIESKKIVLLDSKEKFTNFLTCVKKIGVTKWGCGGRIIIEDSRRWEDNENDASVMSMFIHNFELFHQQVPNNWELKEPKVYWEILDPKLINHNFYRFMSNYAVLAINNWDEMFDFVAKFKTVLEARDLTKIFSNTRLTKQLTKGEAIYLCCTSRKKTVHLSYLNPTKGKKLDAQYVLKIK